MIALLALALPQQQADSVQTFGVWSVRCPATSLDANGRVQCEASASVSDVNILARRNADVIEFEFSSPKCPGVLVKANASRPSLDPSGQTFAMTYQMIDVVLSASLQINANKCPAFQTRFTLNREETNEAFEVVTSRDKPKRRR